MNNRLVSVSAAGGTRHKRGSPLCIVLELASCRLTIFDLSARVQFNQCVFLVFCIVDHRFGGLANFAFAAEGDFQGRGDSLRGIRHEGAVEGKR